MRITVILNRQSGRVNVRELYSALGEHPPGPSIRLLPAGSLEEVRHNARLARRSGVDVIVAAGGDGTVNAVANAMVGSGAALGILPVGTANDFARHLGIPCNISRASRVLSRGVMRTVDLVRVNDAYFLTVGGIGLPAETSLTANTLRSRSHTGRAFARMLGARIYCLGLLSSFFRTCRHPLGVTIDADGASFALQAISLTVANQPCIGRYFNVSPEADVGDAHCHLFVIEKASGLRNLHAILGTVLPRLPAARNTMRLSTRGLVIRTNRPVPFTGDGELLGMSDHFHIEVIPAALKVIVPQGCKRTGEHSGKRLVGDTVYPAAG